MRYIQLLLVCAITVGSASAQSLRSIAYNAKDSIVVRWAPSTIEAWERFNRYGCRIERIDVSSKERLATILNTDTLKPISLEALKQRLPQNTYAPIIAQALYGKDMAPNTSDLRAQMDAADQVALRWSLCGLYADIDPAIANALGYRWVDKDVNATGYYLYRVITLDPERWDTAMVAVDRKQGFDAVPHGPSVTALEKEGSIALRWERELVFGSFSAYWIERRQNNAPWQRLNNVPFVPMDNERGAAPYYTYTDTTIARDYTAYDYRVIGITPFGMVSTEAPMVSAMGRDRTAPPSPEMKAVKDENGRLVVHWEQPAGATDLKGFRVEKTHHAQAAYVPLHRGLLPPSARQFADTSKFLIAENHFRVWAVDTSGNESVSLSGYGTLVDSIAPAPPANLHGSIDTAGVVTVHWPLGKENDILGYRVFFANAADHNFNNLSPEPIQDTVFSDTIPLRTLTKHIYYRVVAVDRNFNHSAMSATLTLLKPDVVAPVAPVFERYAVSDSSVVLHFVPSSSSDVARHRLLRRSDRDTTWREVTAWATHEDRRTWTDRTVEAPSAYTYVMLAMDSADNASPRSVPLEVRLNAQPQRPAVDAVFATPMDQMVQVRWTAPPKPVKHYVIYRSKNGTPGTSIASATADATTYTDIRVPGKGSYRYAVKAVYADGGSSRIVEMGGSVEMP
ncbi:MAG: fibronectin type III domain-containing protein [Flavobacteriales bacterium]|nr:fibronectin type III domain-containing protein [Flavobacteriales bacterium]